jgi:3-oxoacyl-[acyl-carrier protein] reductase
MFRTAIDTLGGLDILVSNAGITRDGLLGMMDDDAWNVVVDTNLKGTFYCCREAVRWMLRKRAGAIVNMSSLSGLMGQPGQTNYAASKGGIIAFTKSLAKEVAEKGIRVNAVAPGFIETEMIGTVADKVLEHNRANIPMRRFGAPEEVANTVVFLASDWARYITGEVINISGGLYM